MLLMFETKRTATLFWLYKRVLGRVPCGPDLEVVAWRALWASKAVHKPGGTRNTPVKRAARRQGIAKWALHWRALHR